MAINSFSKGDIPILIATDVASRGLDFPNIPYVFNYDMPTNIDDYIHRIGRTGRCGNKGTAFSFVTDNCRCIKDLHKLLIKSKQSIPEWFEEMLNKADNYSSYNNSYKRNYGGYVNKFNPTSKNNYSNDNVSLGQFASTKYKSNYTNGNQAIIDFPKKGENFKRVEDIKESITSENQNKNSNNLTRPNFVNTSKSGFSEKSTTYNSLNVNGKFPRCNYQPDNK